MKNGIFYMTEVPGSEIDSQARFFLEWFIVLFVVVVSIFLPKHYLTRLFVPFAQLLN